MTYQEQARVAGTLERHPKTGVEIWPVPSRYGRLWAVGDGKRAFATLAEALDFAERESQ